MDIGSYAQIDDLKKIMDENGIDVPRLRGLRLMKDEKPIDVESEYETVKRHVYENALTSCPQFDLDSGSYEYSWRTDWRKKKYGVIEKVEFDFPVVVDLKWDKIHGKNRKRVKFAVKQACKRCKNQYDAWNKYVGRDDVLYIHARIGGNNWAWYGGADIAREPWFLEKVDDWFDGTYCDIYARIKV